MTKTCKYEHCITHITHKTEDSMLVELTAKIGTEP